MAGESQSEAVAALALQSSAQPEKESLRWIYPHDEFDLGRQDVRAALNLEDRCVSNHHIRVHCVHYDDEDGQRVAPMVYMRVLSSQGVKLNRWGIDDPSGVGIAVDKSQGDILLNPGDRMQLTPKVSIEFRTPGHIKYEPPALDRVQKQEIKRFQKEYQLANRVLGVGGYAAVYVAVKRKTEQQLACKIIKLPTDHDQSSIQLIGDIRAKHDYRSREYNVLKDLSHPNIISLEKVFRTTHTLYIFSELITGGDLMSWLDMNGPLQEPQAAMIVRQLLEAVKYLHDNHVVHRDIKPENILMTSWREGGRIVLTDFGQARTITDLGNAAKKAGVLRMQTQVGTFGYIAPEILTRVTQDLQNKSGYSQAVDIWSIGCVTGTLLTNGHIFPDGDDLRDGLTTLSQFTENINIIDSDDLFWQRVSRKAKDFIRGCLDADERKRLTARGALQHKWFQHSSYKAEFDAAYKRAIQDWKPKVRDELIVEVLDTSDIDVGGETRSKHFPVQQPLPTPVPTSTPAQDMNAMLGRFRPAADFGLNASPVREEVIAHTQPRHPAPQTFTLTQFPLPPAFNGFQTQYETQFANSLEAYRPPESFMDLDVGPSSQHFGIPPTLTMRSNFSPVIR